MAKLEKIVDSNEFYNRIAPDYNAMLTQSGEFVRRTFSETFLNIVNTGNILDFGGGTGLDLPWMVKNFEKIYFLEPSTKMRGMAQEAALDKGMKNKVIFLEDNLDFNFWADNNLPFSEKVDGIAANFAVLNCIENLDLLFEKLALVCNKNAYVLATVINSRPLNILKNYSGIVAFKSMVSNRLKVYNNHKGVGHPTYFFQLKYLKFASSKFFKFISYKPIEGSTFAILTLSKK